MQSFFWMAEQAWSAVMYFWPVSVAVFVIVVAGFLTSWRRLVDTRWITRGWLAAPFTTPVVVLVWGAAMGHSHGVAAPRWTFYVLGLLLFGGLLFIALCIWRAAGVRWLGAALSLCAAWLTCCCAFIAGMALTNDWL